MNEIDILRSLNHPNILKLHEVFETTNSIYFILDLLEGGELSERIDNKVRYSYEEIRSIMRGILEGL